MHVMSTLFTRIVNGEIPCHKVWEDERHLAFLDIRPRRPGHTLVIPKREVNYLFDLDEEEHAALWTAARTVARLLKERLACKRICVGVWGYEVPHAHIHLVPTNAMADFPPAPGTPASDTDLAAVATRVKR
jgi:histidine triad (HIT) family protein